ncbi:MAG: hypothetical protein EBZ48_11565 [Proteobacteria bacterium]|nr:hypothetical protein [Pseudomonadota bacterium]
MKPTNQQSAISNQQSAISSHGSRKTKVDSRGVKNQQSTIYNQQSTISGCRESRAKSPGGDAADPADAGPQGGGTALR